MNSPPKNCQFCPRLCKFRKENTEKFPEYFNGAVPSFGSKNAEILVVGLAPGLHGANATGRPFTGDYAGDILYPALLKQGFATGKYRAKSDDGFALVNTRITNSVRCVPPKNLPNSKEINICNKFLAEEIKNCHNLQLILTLGLVSHKATIKALNLKQKNYKFIHGAKYIMSNKLTIINSYHTSRYNINTKRLNIAMFDDIIRKISNISCQNNQI